MQRPPEVEVQSRTKNVVAAQPHEDEESNHCNENYAVPHYRSYCTNERRATTERKAGTKNTPEEQPQTPTTTMRVVPSDRNMVCGNSSNGGAPLGDGDDALLRNRLFCDTSSVSTKATSVVPIRV
jgi:hypothetical protein